MFTKLPLTKDSPVKYIIYMFPDIRSKSKELAIYSVQDCLEEISFSRILTIKEVKKLKIKREPNSWTIHGKKTQQKKWRQYEVL